MVKPLAEGKHSKTLDMVRTLTYTSNMMRNLMADLLDLAQMEKNTFKLNKGFFDLFVVIQQAFTVVGHIASKKNLELILQPCNEHETALYRHLYGDQNRFMQVLINFLSNAIKFSPPNSPIRVHLNLLQAQVMQDEESIQ